MLKIAEGDFSFEIERTDKDDDIEAILVLVNLLAEEMRETLNYYNVLNATDTIKQYANMLFVLNSSFQIQFANSQVQKTLGIAPACLKKTSFTAILSKKSHQNWITIANNMLYQKEYHNITKLTYLCTNLLTKTLTTAINVIPRSGQEPPLIIISTCQKVLKSQLMEEDLKHSLKAVRNKGSNNPTKPNVLVKEQDMRIMQQIKGYILQNLEHPLPNLRTLANQFGTNEYKLKYGFKQLYGTTVFRYLTQERLKRASLLIQNTSLSIKAVAKMTGFKNVSHFSKAFKNHFGVKPTDMKKLNDNN
ncbi:MULTISPECIES: helix-turn-helix domain-containing protein [Bizionia]|uniref:helix-turn-helix domain-containing protein n=1 Tax=Bizionia TaxID=283785 RepID=UPI001478E7C6|nr:MULTISPECIES: AraC family transcriptional regulator [Bizionia]